MLVSSDSPPDITLQRSTGCETLMWGPGHKGLPCNELTDTDAKTAAKNHQRPFQAHLLRIRRKLKTS